MISTTGIFLSFILVLLAFVFRNIPHYLRYARHAKFAKQLPGPRSLPFIGNGFEFKGDGLDIMKKLWEYVEKYPSPFRLWFGTRLMVVVSETDDLAEIYKNSKTLNKSELFKIFGSYFGNSIFTETDSAKWRVDRRLLQPAFAPGALSNYISIMNENVKVAIDIFSKKLNGEEFDTLRILPHIAFNIITQSVLQKSYENDDKTALLFHDVTNRGMELSFLEMVQPWQRSWFVKSMREKESKYIRETFDNFLKTVAEEKIGQMELEAQERKRLESEGMLDEAPKKSPLNILYDISNEGKQMDKMYAEIGTLVAGGTDTVSTVMSFFLLLMGIYSDIQDKVYEEIYEVFGDSSRDGDEHDMKKLTYLEQVIKETLRRFTLIPFLFRAVQTDCVIGKYTYPAGTGILIFALATHFNPNYYPEPFKFNPDNFSAEAVAKRPKHSFLAFSAGPRGCLGQLFAMLEIKLLLSGLLRNYKFYTNTKMDDIRLYMGYMITNYNGYHVSIKKRIKNEKNNTL